MKIVWFSWKDIRHPQAGGAELLSWQIMRRLAKDGHDVRLITARYNGAAAQENIEGVEIYRTGGRYSVYLKSRALYKKTMSGWPELVIDEMNTLPFFAAFYTNSRSVLLTYQLARSVWFYQLVFPFSLAGFLIEPIYLRILAAKYPLVITESESTRQDLTHYGFDKNKVHIFRAGIEMPPLNNLAPKADLSHVLSLGSIRPMKRTLHAVQGFEKARDTNPKLYLTLAGDDSGRYAQKVINYIKHSRHAEAIKVAGRVSAEERIKLMRTAAVILVTSIKEGWGLIVTEANSQGTPAIAYDTDGLRDSIKNGLTGTLVKAADTTSLGQAISELLNDPAAYNKMREQALQDSRQYTFKNSYADFVKSLSIVK